MNSLLKKIAAVLKTKLPTFDFEKVNQAEKFREEMYEKNLRLSFYLYS